MKKTFLLSMVAAAVFLAGCAGVTSKYPVGLTDYKLDAKAIEGMWFGGGDSANSLKVVDPDKGIFSLTALEGTSYQDKAKPEKFKIMKGQSWLYFNLLPKDKDQGDSYIWGRIVMDKGIMLMWLPSKDAFRKAVEEKKLSGTMKFMVKQDGQKNDEPYSVQLTDEPKKIIDLIETSDKFYFNWDSPVIFIRLTKDMGKYLNDMQ